MESFNMKPVQEMESFNMKPVQVYKTKAELANYIKTITEKSNDGESPKGDHQKMKINY